MRHRIGLKFDFSWNIIGTQLVRPAVSLEFPAWIARCHSSADNPKVVLFLRVKNSRQRTPMYAFLLFYSNKQKKKTNWTHRTKYYCLMRLLIIQLIMYAMIHSWHACQRWLRKLQRAALSESSANFCIPLQHFFLANITILSRVLLCSANNTVTID